MNTTFYDPAPALDRLSAADGLHLAGLLIADLRRNQTTLLAALAASDSGTAVRAAHSIGGVAASAGCESVCTLAATLIGRIRAAAWGEVVDRGPELCRATSVLIDALDVWRQRRQEQTPALTAVQPRRVASSGE